MRSGGESLAVVASVVPPDLVPLRLCVDGRLLGRSGRQRTEHLGKTHRRIGCPRVQLRQLLVGTADGTGVLPGDRAPPAGRPSAPSSAAPPIPSLWPAAVRRANRRCGCFARGCRCRCRARCGSGCRSQTRQCSTALPSARPAPAPARARLRLRAVQAGSGSSIRPCKAACRSTKNRASRRASAGMRSKVATCSAMLTLATRQPASSQRCIRLVETALLAHHPRCVRAEAGSGARTIRSISSKRRFRRSRLGGRFCR